MRPQGHSSLADLLQGLHLVNDAASFGSFTNSFISEFRDDFVKLPIITFLILSEPNPIGIDVDNVSHLSKHSYSG
jgi:hypothetical protein